VYLTWGFQKILYVSLLFIYTLNAATIETEKDTYTIDENITVSFGDLKGQDDEWMAIYPEDSDNNFGNIISWKLTNATVDGNVTFNALPIGTYSIKIFEGSTFLIEKEIIVEGNGAPTTVETTKEVYASDEEITALFENMSGGNEDWIGIYPSGSSNDWEHIILWKWIRGDISGEITFEALPVGEYDVRVFFNNSFTMQATDTFRVEIAESELPKITLVKDVYDPFEIIHVDFENMRGEEGDLIGIFPVGADNNKPSAVELRDTKSLVNGELSFNGLPAGSYEARVYFNDILEKRVSFTVEDKVAIRTLYDDLENGIDPRWTKYYGRDMVLLNVGVPDGGAESTERKNPVNGQHSLRTFNSDGLAQSSGYLFDFQNPDKKFKFLEVDMRIGVSSHRFAFGVKLNTKFGSRSIEFASWLNHTLPSGQQIILRPYGNVLEGHREAFSSNDNYLQVHPGPSDYYVGTSNGMFVHYKINIEEKLRVLEPDNELLGITYFSTSGGDYDNLALSTN